MTLRSVVMTEDNECDSLLPRINRQLLWGANKGSRVVGHGGNRGAVVSSVDSLEITRRAHKEYIPPRTVPPLEKSFVAAAVRMRDASPVHERLVALLGGNDDAADYDFSLWTHLTIPDAVVDDNGTDRGVVMPMMSCNVYDFLTDTHQPKTQLTANPTSCDAYYFVKRFEPIRDPQVIIAMVYQIVRAVSNLQNALPHRRTGSTSSDDSCTGFSHNDLHLANLLLHYDSGALLLCDFELVQHLPAGPGSTLSDRTPPLHRVPPEGLGKSTSDTWGVGLLVVDLLTGVTPFINEAVARDDFGDGPLLSLPEDAGGLPVIDWDANMAPHVHHVREVFPGECPLTDALYDFCGQCLQNSGVTLPEVSELTNHAVFDELRRPSSCPDDWEARKTQLSRASALTLLEGEEDLLAVLRAQDIVRSYVERFCDRRPADRSKMIPRNGSNSSTMLGSTSPSPT